MPIERVTPFGDKRKLVKDISVKPFPAIACIHGIGTGFLSIINNLFVIITAGHCLEEKEINITLGETSTAVQLSFPLKIRASEETFGLPSNYKALSSSDYGIILLEDQDYFREKNFYFLPDIESGERPVMMSGYPGLASARHGVPGYPAKTQWDIEVTDCRTDGTGKFLLYRDATSGGNSGSPLYVKRNESFVAVGIHIGFHGDNIGIRFTKAVVDDLESLVRKVKRRLEDRQKREMTSLIQELILILLELADELEKLERDLNIAKTTFVSVYGASLGAMIGGVILAPFTFGGSLALTVVGAIGGVASGAGALATKIAEKIMNSKKLKAAQEAVRKIVTKGGKLNLVPTVLIGLDIAEMVSNIKEESPSAIAEDIRSIIRSLKEKI